MTSPATPQDKMRETLAKTGLPHKCIRCFGSQILITCWSEGAAKRWISLLGQFATVRGMAEARDYNEENRGTCLKPTTHPVWRVSAFV